MALSPTPRPPSKSCWVWMRLSLKSTTSCPAPWPQPWPLALPGNPVQRPGGALPGKPVGTVYLAGADTRTDTGYLMRLTLGGYQDRQIIRTRAALYALDMLRRMALGLDVPDSVRFTPETADRKLDI